MDLGGGLLVSADMNRLLAGAHANIIGKHSTSEHGGQTEIRNNFVSKRILRVTKWLNQRPVTAICELCGKDFKAPMTALAKTKDAQASLQQQFDLHKCKSET